MRNGDLIKTTLTLYNKLTAKTFFFVYACLVTKSYYLLLNSLALYWYFLYLICQVRLGLSSYHLPFDFSFNLSGSGKTFTMKPLPLRAVRDILRLMHHTYRNQGFQLFVSFFEIYGGKLFDLLGERKYDAHLLLP